MMNEKKKTSLVPLCDRELIVQSGLTENLRYFCFQHEVKSDHHSHVFTDADFLLTLLKEAVRQTT